MRKTTVVMKAANTEVKSVSKELSRVPAVRGCKRPSEQSNARKVRPHAMGWRTNAPVVALERALVILLTPKALVTVLSKVKPRCGFEHDPASDLDMPTTSSLIAEVQYPHTPNVTLPDTLDSMIDSCTRAASRNRYMDFMIGTERETRRRRRNAMNRRTGAIAANIMKSSLRRSLRI